MADLTTVGCQVCGWSSVGDLDDLREHLFRVHGRKEFMPGVELTMTWRYAGEGSVMSHPSASSEHAASLITSPGDACVCSHRRSYHDRKGVNKCDVNGCDCTGFVLAESEKAGPAGLGVNEGADPASLPQPTYVGPLSVLYDRPCPVCRVRTGDHDKDQAAECRAVVDRWLNAIHESADDAPVDTVMNEVVEANALPDNTVIPGHSHPGPERDVPQGESGSLPPTGRGETPEAPRPGVAPSTDGPGVDNLLCGDQPVGNPKPCIKPKGHGGGWHDDGEGCWPIKKSAPDVGSTAQRSKLSWAQAVEAITGIDFDPPPGGGWHLTKDDARDILEAVQYDRRADEEVSSAVREERQAIEDVCEVVAEALTEERSDYGAISRISEILLPWAQPSRDSQGVES